MITCSAEVIPTSDKKYEDGSFAANGNAVAKLEIMSIKSCRLSKLSSRKSSVNRPSLFSRYFKLKTNLFFK